MSVARLTITSIWMFAFVPTSPITKKKKRNLRSVFRSCQYHNFWAEKGLEKIRLLIHRVKNQAFILYYELN